MTLFFAVLTLFAGAALVALASRLGRSHSAWAAGAVTLSAIAWIAPLAGMPFAGATLTQTTPWMGTAPGVPVGFRYAVLIVRLASPVRLHAPDVHVAPGFADELGSGGEEASRVWNTRKDDFSGLVVGQGRCSATPQRTHRPRRLRLAA